MIQMIPGVKGKVVMEGRVLDPGKARDRVKEGRFYLSHLSQAPNGAGFLGIPCDRCPGFIWITICHSPGGFPC